MTLKRLILLLIILPACFVAKSQDRTKATAHEDTIKYVPKSEKFYLNNKKLQVPRLNNIYPFYHESLLTLRYASFKNHLLWQF
jgi:hypothetical protein